MQQRDGGIDHLHRDDDDADRAGCCGSCASSATSRASATAPGPGPVPTRGAAGPAGPLHGQSASSSGRGDCHPNRKAPRGGRLSTGCGCSPWHLGPIRSGVCGFTHALSWAWQGRDGDHVWEKRCSGLDLLGCDPGSGYAARGLNTRGTELAYRSLRLRDDARAASPSSPCVCRIVGAPPLCAPARVIPGRTLLEGRVRVGSRASPQLQGKPLFSWRWPAGVPVPVPAKTRSAAPAVYALGAWICGLRCPQSRFPVSGRTWRPTPSGRHHG